MMNLGNRSKSTLELAEELITPKSVNHDLIPEKRKSRWDSDSDSGSDPEQEQPATKVTKAASSVFEDEKVASSGPVEELSTSDIRNGTRDEVATPDTVASEEDELDKVMDDLHRDRTPGSEGGYSPAPSREVPASLVTRTTTPSDMTDDHNPLFAGCRHVDYFDMVNKVNEGAYGVVFAAKNSKTGELVALKKVKISKESSNRDGFPITALRETNVLLALQHPNIVRVREMVVGKRMDEVFMVMEHFENDLKGVLKLQRIRNMQAREDMLGEGSVNKREFKKVPVFKIREVKCLMSQLLSGMEFMHRCWYLHRDMKTANILYNNTGKLAICDFGLARKFGDPIKPYTTNIVTLYYRPPEILLGAKVYSTEVDMWSVGCIFAEVLLGDYFFEGTSEVDQLSKIFQVMGQPSQESWPAFDQLPNAKMLRWKGMPKESKLRDKFPRASSSASFTDINDTYTLSDVGFNLLEGLLAVDPKKRMSAKQALNHPWFQEEPTALPRHLMPAYPPNET